jgi:hypothetical protein
MQKIELSCNQIIDLIFEKKIMNENITLTSKDSCLAILATLDTRLTDGKIFSRKNTVVCGQDLSSKVIYRG